MARRACVRGGRAGMCVCGGSIRAMKKRTVIDPVFRGVRPKVRDVAKLRGRASLKDIHRDT